MDEWMHWISINEERAAKSTYDVLAELAVSSYNLDAKSRNAELKDMVQYFVRWMFAERSKMKKYKSATAIGELLKKDHATILHHYRKRTPTAMYKENTACLKDFLKS